MPRTERSSARAHSVLTDPRPVVLAHETNANAGLVNTARAFTNAARYRYSAETRVPKATRVSSSKTALTFSVRSSVVADSKSMPSNRRS